MLAQCRVPSRICEHFPPYFFRRHIRRTSTTCQGIGISYSIAAIVKKEDMNLALDLLLKRVRHGWPVAPLAHCPRNQNDRLLFMCAHRCHGQIICLQHHHKSVQPQGWQRTNMQGGQEVSNRETVGQNSLMRGQTENSAVRGKNDSSNN